MSASGSGRAASTTCTRRRVRSTWRRNSSPRPRPRLAPSMSPGMSATTSSLSSNRATPRLGTSVVNGKSAIFGRALVSAARSVDFPAFGRPVRPTSARSLSSSRISRRSPLPPSSAIRGARRVLLTNRALPFPAAPPRAITSSSPGDTRSAMVRPVASSTTTVPTGTRTTRSVPALPVCFRPAPAPPDRAASSCANRNSVSVPSSGSTRNTTSPPFPPSPPSGPPRGTCASRRNEITPRPPSPAFTTTRALSRNTLDARERSSGRGKDEMRRVGAKTLERDTHPERTVAAREGERATRARVRAPQHQRAPRGQLAGEPDDRVELARSVGQSREREHHEREGHLPARRLAERRAHVGEAIALGAVDRFVRVRAPGGQPDRDGVDAGVVKAPQRDGQRAVRLEVDRRVRCPGADAPDRVFDLANGEKRLALAGPAARHEGAARLQVRRRDVGDLLRRGVKGGGLGRRRVAVGAERDEGRGPLGLGRADRECAGGPPPERVRRGTARIIARAAGELTELAVRGPGAERRAHARRAIRRRARSRPAAERCRRRHELAVLAGADGHVRAWRERLVLARFGVGGKGEADPAPPEHPGRPEPPRAQTAHPAAVVEAPRLPSPPR